MYIKEALRVLKIEPQFARYYYIDNVIRKIYMKITHKKLRLKHYAKKIVHSNQETNEELKRRIEQNIPFIFARYGMSELTIMNEAVMVTKDMIPQLDLKKLERVCFNSGFFPVEEKYLKKFSELMLEISDSFDLFGTFRGDMEDYYIRNYMSDQVYLSHLNAMDFWRYEIPFTSALRGKKVLVIHPYAETIEKQYAKRELLFDNPNVLPEFELYTLKAVQTIGKEKDERFKTWFDALEYMFEEAMKIDFDIAILGCGAYGVPLAAKLRKCNKSAIYMGGVTQMLFGIKGKRWDMVPEATALYNEHWVRPSEKEIPDGANKIEGGCYW